MTRRALAGREEKVGVDHPNTLGSVYNLVYLFPLLERYDVARPYNERACAGYNRQLGESHPTTMACEQHFSDVLSAMHNTEIEMPLAVEVEGLNLQSPESDRVFLFVGNKAICM